MNAWKKTAVLALMSASVLMAKPQVTILATQEAPSLVRGNLASRVATLLEQSPLISFLQPSLPSTT